MEMSNMGSARNVKRPASRAFDLESLESRMLLAATPAQVLTKAMRQDLLNNLNISIKSTLQSRLKANDMAGFDTKLLDFMKARTGTHFFFEPSDVNSYLSYIDSNLNNSDVTSRANAILSNLYPEQDTSLPYTVSIPDDVDWTKTNYTTNPETVHTLNRHFHWVDLAMAYRIDGNGAYADKLIGQLGDWASQSPALADPDSWHDHEPAWWRLNAAVRAENWSWTYSLMLGTDKWSKEANTLFMVKSLEQAKFLYQVEPAALTSNQAFLHGQGLLYTADLFPEFTGSSTWQAAGRDLVFRTMDAQFYNDGSHAEQSPNYAVLVARRLLETKQLDNETGVNWSSARNNTLKAAVDAFYQILSPDRRTPAISDSYRQDSDTLWLKADLVLGTNDYPAGTPSTRDVWMFGPGTVDPYLDNDPHPALGSRPNDYALTDGGYYIARSGSDANARQLIFDAGPKGSTHGHSDLFNFELFGYGAPLISDPGIFRYDTSAARTWAISTPAHNTISIDGSNVGPMEGAGNPGIVVDSYVTDDDHMQITAHHYGYGFLSGRPVVSRSLWYDYDGTLLVVDWVEASQAHNVRQSFLLPTTSTSRGLAQGWIRSTNGSGGNVKIQTLLQSGQKSTYKTAGIFTSNDPPPNHTDPATQFFTYQVGSFVCFATLVTAYNGTTPPDITASLLNTPAKGQPVNIRLNKSGSTEDIAFTPPALTRPDSNGSVRALYSDIAYDKSGRVHMAYLDRDDQRLKYTVRDTNGVWSAVETVDATSGAGYSPSIAIDGKGNIGIAYNDSPHGDLKYAQYVQGAWKIQTVDSRGTTGLYPSLAFTRGNSPTISYYDRTKGDLRLAAATSTGWAAQTLDTGSAGDKDTGRYSQLMLDPSRPTASKWVIFYQDNGAKQFKYAVQGALRNGVQKSGYTFFTVANASKLGGYTSLSFDSSNRPIVSFYDAAISGLRWGRSDGDTFGGIDFSVQTVTEKGTTGLYTNIYTDSSKRPTILYFDKTKNSAMKAVFSSNRWTAAPLITGGREIHVAKYNNTVAFTNLNQGLGSIQVKFL
jgi:hypothetical protein